MHGTAVYFRRIAQHYPNDVAVGDFTPDVAPAESLRLLGMSKEVVERERVISRALEAAALFGRNPQLAVRTETEAMYRTQDSAHERALSYVSKHHQLQRVASDPRPPLPRPASDRS